MARRATPSFTKATAWADCHPGQSMQPTTCISTFPSILFFYVQSQGSCQPICRKKSQAQRVSLSTSSNSHFERRAEPLSQPSPNEGRGQTSSRASACVQECLDSLVSFVLDVSGNEFRRLSTARWPLYLSFWMFREMSLGGYPQPVGPLGFDPVGEHLAWMAGRLLRARTVAGWLCSTQTCTDLVFARMGDDKRE
jgi:hypothetical protein